MKSSKDILQAPRGMRDFFGKEFSRRKNFFNIAEKIAEQYGFSGIETPIMEHTPIFHKGVGEGTDIVDKEMYNLETSGGDKLTLRPEGTAAIMRSYIEHGMGSEAGPKMFHYSGPYFRHEKPQKGRYRQLYQFGLEIMGSKSPLYDALIIQTGFEIISETKKNIFVEINSLGSNQERADFIQALKKFYTENISEVADSDISRIESNPLRILDSKEASTKNLNSGAPKLYDYLGEESRLHFSAVTNKLEELDIPYEIVPELVRGLGYYEHTVFEYVVRDENGKNSHALGGGGRYDGLAETIGHNKAVPSVGLGLGADRIVEISSESFASENTKIPLIIADESAFSMATKIARESDGKIFFYPLTQKFVKQISRIEKESYEKVFILGENEISEEIIILKDLVNRSEEKIAFTEIKNYLK